MTGIYNVRDYKTPETGNDYKDAIQKAVQAAKDNGGGEVVIPGGHYLVSGPILLEGCSNVTVRGWGARMQRIAATSGQTQTSFFRINGCTTVKILGLHLIGSWSATTASTGSEPPILIGTVTPTNTAENHDIEVAHCTIRGGNWAAIVVYGRRLPDPPTPDPPFFVRNQNINIHHNTIEDSSMGIFVYKNADGVLISGNYIHGTGQDGIAVDTRAASDKREPEPIHNVTITDNVCLKSGLLAQGIGILMKGANQVGLVANNLIEDVGIGNANVVNHYGILINQDWDDPTVEVPGPGTPAQISVIGNVVRNVTGAGLNGFGIYVGFATDMVVADNLVEATQTTGLFVSKSKHVRVTNNLLRNVTMTSGYGLRVEGDSNGGCFNVDVSSNRITRDSTVAATTVGMHVTFTTGFTDRGNDIQGFGTPVTLADTVSNVLQGVDRALPVVSTSSLSGTIAAHSSLSTTVAVAGAVAADFVEVTHNNPANAASLIIQGTVTAAGTVTVTAFNPSGAAVTLGNGAWYVRVTKRTR